MGACLTSRASSPINENGEQKSVLRCLRTSSEDVVVVVFLANHCAVVRGYEDRIIDFTKDYTGKGVKVVGFPPCRRRRVTSCLASKTT